MLPFKIVAKTTQSKYGIINFAARASMGLNFLIVSKINNPNNKISIKANKVLFNPKNKKLQMAFKINWILKSSKAFLTKSGD